MTPHRLLWTLLSRSAGSVAVGSSKQVALPPQRAWPAEQAIWHLAEREGVLATASHVLLVAGLPRHWQQPWERVVQQSTAEALQRLARAAHLNSVVPDLSWMKGVFLAQQAYPALGARRVGHDDDCLGTIASLRTFGQLGWQAGFPGHGAATAQQIIDGWTIGQEIDLVDPHGGVDIDLHRLPVRCVPALAQAAQALWSGAERRGGLRMMDPAAHGLTILLSLANDGWLDWRHLIDLAHLESRFGLPWQAWWQELPPWRPLFATQAYLLQQCCGLRASLPSDLGGGTLARRVAREFLTGTGGRSNWPRTDSARWLWAHAGWHWRRQTTLATSPP